MRDGKRIGSDCHPNQHQRHRMVKAVPLCNPTSSVCTEHVFMTRLGIMAVSKIDARKRSAQNRIHLQLIGFRPRLLRAVPSRRRKIHTLAPWLQVEWFHFTTTALPTFQQHFYSLFLWELRMTFGKSSRILRFFDSRTAILSTASSLTNKTTKG